MPSPFLANLPDHTYFQIVFFRKRKREKDSDATTKSVPAKTIQKAKKICVEKTTPKMRKNSSEASEPQQRCDDSDIECKDK